MPSKTDDFIDEASEETKKKTPAKRTRKTAAKADADDNSNGKKPTAKPAAKRGRKSAAGKAAEKAAEANAEESAADVAIPAPRRKVSLRKAASKKADAPKDASEETAAKAPEPTGEPEVTEKPSRKEGSEDRDEKGGNDAADYKEKGADSRGAGGDGEGDEKEGRERRGGRHNDRRRQREEERRNRRERRRKESRGRGRRDFDDDEETIEEAGEDNSIQQRRLNLAELKEMPMEKLYELAEEFEVENYANYPQQELLGKFLQKQAERKGHSYTVGTLAIGGKEKYGFLRSPKYSYMAGPDDIYVSPNQIRKYALRAGDTIAGTIRRPSKSEKFWALLKIDSINGETINDHKQKTLFTNLTSVYPDEQLNLEYDPKDLTSRVIDLMCPIGKGQRGLIVAPPRTGKTVILQKIAKAIEANHPEVFLFVLLIDERPEEVTDMRRTVKGEVVASTFDEKPQRHAEVSEIVIEKAKRLVEAKKDVVILLDSITRLGRAYNVLAPSQGKLLSGGIEANALMMPKKFFGAARNVEEGGSLTILGTALVDTGSKMDEYIFEEFKGTGNMEMHLDRILMDRRVFPAMNISKSGTRKEELLLDEKTLQRTWLLRKALKDLDVVETMEFLAERLRKTDTNQEFLDQMNI